MPLIATPGAPKSNSYADVAAANAYHSQRAHNPEWSAADTPAKETALEWATTILDDLEWRGGIASTSQALRWPRIGIVDRDGRSLPANTIPAFLIRACSELAFQLLKEDWTQGGGSMVATATASLGPIQTPVKRHRPIPPSVLTIIRPYLKGQSQVVRA